MKLKQYLKNNRVKQKDFAEALGISAPHLSQIANGVAVPSLKLSLLIKRQTKGLVDPEDYFLDLNNAA